MPQSYTLFGRPPSLVTWPMVLASKVVWAFLLAAIYYGNPERQSGTTIFMQAVAYVLLFLPAALVLLVAVPIASYRLYRDDRLRTRSHAVPLAFGGASLSAALLVLVAHAAYQLGRPGLINFLDHIL